MACERFVAPPERLGMVLVVLRNTRVEIPAQIVERPTRSLDQLRNLSRVHVLQALEPDHDVGHLHAGVVDIVLDLDVFAGGAQHAHKRVAENGVAQMADMRGLVRVDIGVLDDHLSRAGSGVALEFERGAAVGAAVEAHVDVAVSGNLESANAGNRTDLRNQLRGDGPRRLPQLFGKLKGHRHGQFAEVRLPRLFEQHRRIDAMPLPHVSGEPLGNLLFKTMKQCWSSQKPHLYEQCTGVQQVAAHR